MTKSIFKRAEELPCDKVPFFWDEKEVLELMKVVMKYGDICRRTDRFHEHIVSFVYLGKRYDLYSNARALFNPLLPKEARKGYERPTYGTYLFGTIQLPETHVCITDYDPSQQAENDETQQDEDNQKHITCGYTGYNHRKLLMLYRLYARNRLG